MHLNRILLYALVFISIVGCNASSKLIGNYCNGKNKRISNSEETSLEIKSDKTFTVNSFSDVAGNFSSQGDWKIINDTIFFLVKEKKIIDTIFYTQNSALSGKTNIKFIDAITKTYISNIRIIVNGNNYTFENGYGTIDFEGSNHLLIDLLSTKPEAEILKNKNVNIEVIINFNNLKSIRLDSLYKFSGNTLKPLQGGNLVFKRCK